MQVDRFLRDPQSRRVFFRRSGVVLAGGSAVFVAACGGGGGGSAVGGTAEDPGGGPRDVDLLNAALDLELMAVAAYAAGTRILRGDARDVGQLFADQEREHVQGLTQAVRDLGGRPNKPKDDYDLPELEDQEDVFTFALDLENTAIAAYLDVLPKLTSPQLRATAAAIITNEAEHVSVLLGALGRPQVPDAFVTGKA